LSILSPVVLSQSLTVILCFRSACVCICTLKIWWMRDSHNTGSPCGRKLLTPSQQLFESRTASGGTLEPNTQGTRQTVCVWEGRQKNSHMGRPITYNEVVCIRGLTHSNRGHPNAVTCWVNYL
jgi:hypothetical protein